MGAQGDDRSMQCNQQSNLAIYFEGAGVFSRCTGRASIENVKQRASLSIVELNQSYESSELGRNWDVQV